MASEIQGFAGFEDPYESLIRRGAEDRIRAILGLPSGSFLPPVNRPTLVRYFEYLSNRLTLPFEARYYSESERVVFPVTVIELVSPNLSPADPSDGLLCATYLRDKSGVLPLAEIEPPEDSPNFQMIEDYWYWVWNWCGAWSDSLRTR
jgi:hypothetical protein